MATVSVDPRQRRRHGNMRRETRCWLLTMAALCCTVGLATCQPSEISNSVRHRAHHHHRRDENSVTTIVLPAGDQVTPSSYFAWYSSDCLISSWRHLSIGKTCLLIFLRTFFKDKRRSIRTLLMNCLRMGFNWLCFKKIFGLFFGIFLLDFILNSN